MLVSVVIYIFPWSLVGYIMMKHKNALGKQLSPGGFSYNHRTISSRTHP